MLKKRIIAASLAAMLTAPAFAGSLGDWTVGGFALYEVWGDTNQGATDQIDYKVFTLHNIELSSAKKTDIGSFVWKVAQRLRNGDYGGEGSLGHREAWAGFEGDYGTIAFGRFLNRIWTVLDWPYGAVTYQAETLAETGSANWVTTRAIRYHLPAMGPVDAEFTYDVCNTSDAGRCSMLEAAVHAVAGPATIDAIYSKTSNAGNWLAVGTLGSDGQPGVNTETWQSTSFIGTRVNVGSGFTVTGGYKINKWHNDAGLGESFTTVTHPDTWEIDQDPLSPTYGTLILVPHADTVDHSGSPIWAWDGYGMTKDDTDVTSSQILADVRWASGKELIALGVIMFQESEANDTGGLNDKARSIGFKWEHSIARGANVYGFVRNYKTQQDMRPVATYPWQFGNLMSWGGDNSSMTRFGIGGQLLF